MDSIAETQNHLNTALLEKKNKKVKLSACFVCYITCVHTILLTMVNSLYKQVHCDSDLNFSTPEGDDVPSDNNSMCKHVLHYMHHMVFHLIYIYI